MEIVYYLLGLYCMYNAIALLYVLIRILKGETMRDIYADIKYREWERKRFNY